MIGIVLSSRRREFFQFAAENAILYDEILDFDDIEKINSFDAIFSDHELSVVGVNIKLIAPDELFTEVLSQYVMGKAKSEVKTKSVLEWHFDKYYRSLARFAVTFELEPVEVLAEQVKTQQVQPPVIDAPNILRKSEFPVLDLANIDENNVHQDSIALGGISQQIGTLQQDTVDLDVMVEPASDNLNTVPGIPNSGYNLNQRPMPSQPSGQFGYGQSEYEQLPNIRRQPVSYGYEQPAPPSIFNTSVPQQAPPTQLFSQNQMVQQAVNQPVQRGFGGVPMRANSTEGMIRARNSLAAKKRMYQVPIFTFSSLTPKAGVTTLAFALAAVLAIQQPMSKVLYLDLNVSNPNFIANYMNINPNTDACVKTIMNLSESEFMSNITLLTETVMISGASFSVITMGQLSFQERKMIADSNFTFFLETIGNSFDIIIVDCGELQSTLPYQGYMLSSNVAKHFVVADGSDNRFINTFIRTAQQVACNFEVIVNKNIPQAGAFAISQRLRQMPIATIGLHRNINHYLSGQLPIQDTALFHELCDLGGKL